MEKGQEEAWDYIPGLLDVHGWTEEEFNQLNTQQDNTDQKLQELESGKKIAQECERQTNQKEGRTKGT